MTPIDPFTGNFVLEPMAHVKYFYQRFERFRPPLMIIICVYLHLYLGGNGEQQEESEAMQSLLTEATHHTTSSVDLAIIENNSQLKNKEENSCIIVENLLSSEPDHQIDNTTSSEFELGMTAAPSNNAHQIIVDSPIKVPKVTEEFSQDTFSSLNIQGMHQIFLYVCVYLQ